MKSEKHHNHEYSFLGSAFHLEKSHKDTQNQVELCSQEHNKNNHNKSCGVNVCVKHKVDSCANQDVEQTHMHKSFTSEITNKINEFIGHFHEAPHFTIDSQWILRGYRINFATPRKVIRSLFMTHNETMNIWTHLLGVCLMVLLIILLGFTAASTFTYPRMENFTMVKLNAYFDPLYNKITSFNELELSLKNQIEVTKKDLRQFKSDAIQALEENIQIMISELEHIKQELEPTTAIELLKLLDMRFDSISTIYETIQNSIGNIHLTNLEEVPELANRLKTSIVEFQEILKESIGTSNYDWIDIYTYFDDHPHSVHLREMNDPHKLSRWPIFIFLLSAIVCLSGSTAFHLFYCMSLKVNTILLRIDHAGICILIFGSCFPPLVYGFYCQPYIYQNYLTAIGISSLIVFTISMMDFIHTEKWRKIKSLMYGGLGLFAGFSITHLMVLSLQVGLENDHLPFTDAIPYYTGMGISYLFGLAIYTYRCPERFKPGTFDICGHSHQLWHICVLSGIIFHYIASFENYYTRIDISCMVV